MLIPPYWLPSGSLQQKTKTAVLWIVILLLAGVVVWQNFDHAKVSSTHPKLGKPGSELFNTINRKTAQESGKIGASVPASFTVSDNKAQVTIRNTGQVAVAPSCIIAGKEVYRSSRVLNPGESVTAVIAVPSTAQKCVTMVESVDGKKFTITSDLQRG